MSKRNIINEQNDIFINFHSISKQDLVNLLNLTDYQLKLFEKSGLKRDGRSSFNFYDVVKYFYDLYNNKDVSTGDIKTLRAERLRLQNELLKKKLEQNNT